MIMLVIDMVIMYHELINNVFMTKDKMSLLGFNVLVTKQSK